MKQFVLKKSGNEFDEESKKYERMNDKLNELYEKLQGDVSEEEGDAIIEEFQNLIKNCGAAFELNVIPTLEGPIVTGKTNASYAFLQVIEGMSSDEVKECFTECTKAFGMEMRRQLTKHRKKENTEASHYMH